jgi:hypothetical protein
MDIGCISMDAHAAVAGMVIHDPEGVMPATDTATRQADCMPARRCCHRRNKYYLGKLPMGARKYSSADAVRHDIRAAET